MTRREEQLCGLLIEGCPLWPVDEDLYSVLPAATGSHQYDSKATAYDLVIGTRLHNHFDGDPRLRRDDTARARELGRFSNIVGLVPGESGILQGARNFRIDPALAARNQLVNGWYRQ